MDINLPKKARLVSFYSAMPISFTAQALRSPLTRAFSAFTQFASTWRAQNGAPQDGVLESTGLPPWAVVRVANVAKTTTRAVVRVEKCMIRYVDEERFSTVVLALIMTLVIVVVDVVPVNMGVLMIRS